MIVYDDVFSTSDCHQGDGALWRNNSATRHQGDVTGNKKGATDGDVGGGDYIQEAFGILCDKCVCLYQDLQQTPGFCYLVLEVYVEGNWAPWRVRAKLTGDFTGIYSTNWGISLVYIALTGGFHWYI